jgi:hypothetical protein
MPSSTTEREGSPMARVLGLREVELRAGVDPAEYERIFAEEIPSSAIPTGLRARLLKGERGVRAGKFLVLLEMEDRELLDLYFPTEDGVSEETERFLEQHPDAATAWDKLSALEAENVVTNYVVVVE